MKGFVFKYKDKENNIHLGISSSSNGMNTDEVLLTGPLDLKYAYIVIRTYQKWLSIIFKDKIDNNSLDLGPFGVWTKIKEPFKFFVGPKDRLICGVSGIIWRCNICGSKNIDTETCHICKPKECLVCRDCYQLGPVRSCQFYLWKKPINKRRILKQAEPKIPFELTSGQKNAVKELQTKLLAGKKTLLLHAACGAGKTEVASLIIGDFLKSGGKILYSVPRRDVAVEVGERLKEYFPNFDTAILYGGTSDRYADQSLIAATTHQVIRFYKAFDLTILDEGDAFPFKGNLVLERAVVKATKGPIIYMTATPTDSMKKMFSKDDIVFIPARHHRKPLPVPKFYQGDIKDIIKECAPPLLLFVPFKKDVLPTVNWLREVKPKWRVEGISSETIGRSNLIQAIKEDRLDALVSTSVLERGITVSGVTVVVKNADCDKIYTREVLVQIAGRAGRTVKSPEGEVVFVAKRVNKIMKEARDQIVALNEMALKRGEISC